MGEASRRGSKAERIRLAQARIDALKPASEPCGQCHTVVTGFEPFDIRGFPGIVAAFSAVCPTCSHRVWAVTGKQSDDVTAFMAAIASVSNAPA